jgi:hypothetical protein
VKEKEILQVSIPVGCDATSHRNGDLNYIAEKA